MLTTEKKKKYTDKDYMMLEEGAPFQLINYELIMSPSPSILHQRVFVRLTNIVTYFSADHTEGEWFYTPTDVKFDDGNVYQPDLLYISESRRAEIIKKRIEGAPDLVIEILSPSNAYYDLRQKKDIYEKYGVKEYIIIDLAEESAELYYLEGNKYVMKHKAQKSEELNSIILEGLIIDLKKVFI